MRAIALVIDQLLMSIVFAIIFIPLFITMGGMSIFAQLGRARVDPDMDPSQVLGPAFVLMILAAAGIGLVVGWLYYAYSESSAAQATLGKRALGLYVTDLNGQRISFARASARYFCKIITGMVPLFIGYILAGVTQRKQALHDMIAACLVLRR